VRVGNPLAADASVLRSNGLVSMARALAWNLNRGQRDVRLFEMGRVYAMKNGAPVETPIVSLGATGAARQKGVSESGREYEFADLKGDLDQIGELAGGFAWSAATAAKLPWANAARVGQIQLAGNAGDATGGAFGGAGELARRVADQFKIRQNVFLAEISLVPFYEGFRIARAARTYRPISRFPSVERDFSLTLNDGTAFADVRRTIEALGITAITSVEAVDLFRGKNVPSGKFSLLVRVTFQSLEGTLTEPEVNEFSARIVAALEQQLSATLRAS
jgi:phenylalanyl-tRNA synthetase beta chain